MVCLQKTISISFSYLFFMYLPYNLRRIFEKGSKIIGDEDVLVIAHKDADGFISYALLNKVFNVKGVFFLNNLSPQILENIPKDFEGYIFADVGNNNENLIFNKLKDKKVLIIDHHPTTSEKIIYGREQLNLNSYLLGIDGFKSISSSGLCFLLSKTYNKYEDIYNFLPLVGAFSDMQMKSPKGFNKFFLENAIARGEIYIEHGIFFPMKSIRPVYKSIEMLFNEHGIPYTPQDAILLMKEAGISPYKIERMRKIPIKASDLTEEEKRILSTHIAIELHDKGIKDDLGDIHIVMDKYLLQEFTTLINAAVKMSKIKEGLRLAYNLDDIYPIYEQYRKEVGKSFTTALNNIKEHGNIKYYIFSYRELKDASLTGTIANMLIKQLNAEIVLIGYEYEDIIKFSIRSKDIDIGSLVREFCSNKEECVGNGHPNAAGGTIKKEDLMELLNYIHRFSLSHKP